MIEKIACRIFGKIVNPYVDYFENLKANLRKSGIKASVDEYFCSILFYAVIALVLVMIFGAIFFSMIMTEQVAYSYTLAIITGLVTAVLVFIFGYYYPSIKASGIQNQIDKSLPFAVFHMSTSASSGVSATEVFAMLSMRKGIIAEEAKRIYMNVRTMGMSLSDALQRAALRTPSMAFADLLWGMSSIVTTGGSIEKYLTNKTDTFMSHYRRSLNDYAKAISLYTEIYITLIIVGSLLFIVLLAIMSPISNVDVLFLQTFLVFFMIPLVSMGFMVLLKGISPME